MYQINLSDGEVERLAGGDITEQSVYYNKKHDISLIVLVGPTEVVVSVLV